MLKFLKENSYNIVRLYINQIGITIFSLVLYFSALAASDDLSKKLLLIISVFASLFLYALLYTAAWDWGANDKIRVDSGKTKAFMLKGAAISLCSNTLNFVLALGCIISELIASGGNGTVYQIFNPIYLLTNAMYIGSVDMISQTNLIRYICFFAAPILAIVATQIGYFFGMKNIKILGSSQKKKN